MPVSFSMYLLGMSAVKMRNRGLFIIAHQATVAFDIGAKDSGKFAFHVRAFLPPIILLVEGPCQRVHTQSEPSPSPHSTLSLCSALGRSQGLRGLPPGRQGVKPRQHIVYLYAELS